MQETWVQSLGWEDPLEENMATRSSILAWRIHVNRGTWWATAHGVTKSRAQVSDSLTSRPIGWLHVVTLEKEMATHSSILA